MKEGRRGRRKGQREGEDEGRKEGEEEGREGGGGGRLKDREDSKLPVMECLSKEWFNSVL